MSGVRMRATEKNRRNRGARRVQAQGNKARHWGEVARGLGMACACCFGMACPMHTLHTSIGVCPPPLRCLSMRRRLFMRIVHWYLFPYSMSIFFFSDLFHTYRDSQQQW